MTKWLIIITLLITVGIFGFLFTQTVQTPVDGADRQLPASNELAVVHSYKDGVHRYAGRLRLSHSCYAVSAETQTDPSNPKNQRIVIAVVDNMAKEGFCTQLATRYPFQVLLDAPEDVSTTLEVNGNEVPMKIYETGWQNPSSGGYLSPINKTGL